MTGICIRTSGTEPITEAEKKIATSATTIEACKQACNFDYRCAAV